jgi:hypothetical protein
MKGLTLLLLCIFAVSCASGKCRQKKDERTFIEHANNLPNFKTKENKEMKPGDLDVVKIYQADGTRQCEPARPIPATDLKKKLEDNKIKVLRIEHTTDGVMHTQVCGADTGRIYVLDIQSLNLDKALKLGFKKYSDLKR